MNVMSEGGQQQVMEGTKQQPDEIEEKLKIVKESIKSKLDKFNLSKQTSKKSIKTKLLLNARGFSQQECGRYS